MAPLKADRRLYVTADRSEIVEEGDPRGAWLLAGVGSQIGEGDVAKYRLSEQGGKVILGKPRPAPAPGPVEDKAIDEGEDKAMAGPPATGPNLDALTKDELVALAEERGVEVTRQDGEDAPPLKSDYVRALSG